MRPLQPTDAAAVLRLQVAVEAADRDGEHYDLDDVAEELADPELDLATDTVGVVDGGLLVAQLRVRSSGDVLEVSGGVHPAARRQGHGTVLLDWARTRAAARGRRTLSARTNAAVPGAAALFTRAGMVPVRRWFAMQRPLAAGLPALGVAGVVTTPVTTPVGTSGGAAVGAGAAVGSAVSEQLRLVHIAAFSGHWGSQPPTPQRWAQHYVGSPHWRPATSVLARDGGPDGAIVGYALGYEWPADTAQTGVREAWLGQLGVLPDRRGRGIGSLLLASFVERAATAGYGRVGLGVDAANASNALALYSRAGFAVTAAFTTYEGPAG